MTCWAHTVNSRDTQLSGVALIQRQVQPGEPLTFLLKTTGNGTFPRKRIDKPERVGHRFEGRKQGLHDHVEADGHISWPAEARDYGPRDRDQVLHGPLLVLGARRRKTP